MEETGMGIDRRVGEFWHPCRGAIRSARDPGVSLRSPPGYCLATLRVAEGRFEGARSQAFSLGYTMTGFQRLIGRGRFMPRPFWHLSNPSVIGGAIGD